MGVGAEIYDRAAAGTRWGRLVKRHRGDTAAALAAFRAGEDPGPAATDGMVTIRKGVRDPGPGGGGRGETAAIAKAAEETRRVNATVDEALALIEHTRQTGDRAGLEEARLMLRDPAAAEAYSLRTAGKRYEAPVAKAAPPEEDHRPLIKRLVAGRAMEALRELTRDPVVDRQYQSLCAARAFDDPAPLSGAEAAEIRKSDAEAIKRKLVRLAGTSGTEASRELAALLKEPAAAAAWRDLVMEGKVKPMGD